MNIKNNLFVILILGALCGCNSDPSDLLPQNVVEEPVSASLVFPENHTECNEGTIVSKTKSKVAFLWNASANTDSYELILTKVETSEVSNFEVDDTTKEISLERGTNYEWYVISKSLTSAKTAKSETYEFFNAAPGIVSHVPFSAEVIAPENNSIVAAVSGKITLRWEASDIDDDIKNYVIFIGTDKEVLENKGLQAVPSFEMSVTSGTSYYWMVETHDEANNVSTSEVFSFTVE